METFKQPKLAVDIIIHLNKGDSQELVLIERKNPPLGWALPGGFVDEGETLEHAAIREAKEETGLDVTLVRQFQAYSEPTRDPRCHVVTIVFVAKASGTLKAADDAKNAGTFSKERLPSLVFDHQTILDDYFSGKY